jgi:hypothetical protein
LICSPWGAVFLLSEKNCTAAASSGDQRPDQLHTGPGCFPFTNTTARGGRLDIEVSSRIDSALRNLYSEYDYRELVKSPSGRNTSGLHIQGIGRLVDLVGEFGRHVLVLLGGWNGRSEYAVLIDLARKKPAGAVRRRVDRNGRFPVPLPTLRHHSCSTTDDSYHRDRPQAPDALSPPSVFTPGLLCLPWRSWCRRCWRIGASARLVVARVEGLEQAMIRPARDGAPFRFSRMAGNEERSGHRRGVEKCWPGGASGPWNGRPSTPSIRGDRGRSKREAELARALRNSM